MSTDNPVKIREGDWSMWFNGPDGRSILRGHTDEKTKEPLIYVGEEEEPTEDEEKVFEAVRLLVMAFDPKLVGMSMREKQNYVRDVLNMSKRWHETLREMNITAVAKYGPLKLDDLNFKQLVEIEHWALGTSLDYVPERLAEYVKSVEEMTEGK